MTFSRVRRLYITPKQRAASIYRMHFPYAFASPFPTTLSACLPRTNARERNNYLKARINGGI